MSKTDYFKEWRDKDSPCDWCSDNTCECYWQVICLGHKRTICNCCYRNLKQMTYTKGIATKDNLIRDTEELNQ